MSSVSLSPLDWTLFALLLFASSLIGVFYSVKDSNFGRKLLRKFRSKKIGNENSDAKFEDKNAKDEYLVGGRRMRVFPVWMSMMASFLSAILVIGTPAEVYQFGFAFWSFIFGILFALVFVSHVALPVLYDLRLTSAYEYLEKRFRSKWPRRLGAGLFILETLLYMGGAMFAPAVALEGVTHFNSYVSMLILGVICTFYTSIGGIKAVMWTDVLQMLIMFVGLLAVLLKGYFMTKEGFSEIWEIADEGSRLTIVSWSTDIRTRHSIFSLVLGSFFVWMAKYGFNQSSVQRFSSLPSRNKAILTMYLNGPGVALMHVLACICGIILYATFHACDLRSANVISSDNQMILYFVVKYLVDSPGMAGLFTAAIFAGALSTISSGLNSLTAIVCEDVLGERHFARHSQRRQFRIMIGLSAFFGAASTGMAFVAKNLKGNITAIIFQFFSITTGPTGGIFLCGLLFPCIEWIGVTAGGITGFSLAAWMFLGQSITRPSWASPLLNISISGCDDLNITIATTTNPVTMVPNTETENPAPLRDSLYSVSYLYWSLIGNLSTIFVAFVVSNIVRCTRRKRASEKAENKGDVNGASTNDAAYANEAFVKANEHLARGNAGSSLSENSGHEEANALRWNGQDAIVGDANGDLANKDVSNESFWSTYFGAGSSSAKKIDPLLISPIVRRLYYPTNYSEAPNEEVEIVETTKY